MGILSKKQMGALYKESTHYKANGDAIKFIDILVRNLKADTYDTIALVIDDQELKISRARRPLVIEFLQKIEAELKIERNEIESHIFDILDILGIGEPKCDT